MKVIFSHQDNSGDVVGINEGPRAGEISVDWQTEGSAYVNLSRDAVQRLWLALGEWLHPDADEMPLPYANRSLIDQLIERAVKDQVTAILPLHLAPVATLRCDYDCSNCNPDDDEPEPHDVGHADEPVAKTCPHGILWTLRCPRCPNPDGLRQHPTEDEWAKAPGRRVGNDGVPLPYCKEQYGGCGHSWGQHTGEGCKARNFDLSNRAHNPCGCTARPQASTS